MDDTQLIDRLVETFGTFDDLRASRDLVTGGELTPLLLEPWSARRFAGWRPIRHSASADDLALLYRRIAGPLPPLFVQLLSSYRWYQVDIGPIRLLNNLPPALAPFSDEVRLDRRLFEALIRVDCVQFG